MNDQMMMSQQRLGPFEMNTKTVSTRRPPLAPYNKVTSLRLCFIRTPHNLELLWLTGCCNRFQVPSSTAGSSSTVNRTDIPRFTEPTQVMYDPVGSVYTERHAATTLRGDKLLRVYRSGDMLLQQVARHVAATNRLVFTGEFWWKSLSTQQNFVAVTSWANSIWFDFVRLVAVTKFCCGDKDFRKNSRFVAVKCCCNVLASMFRGP